MVIAERKPTIYRNLRCYGNKTAFCRQISNHSLKLHNVYLITGCPLFERSFSYAIESRFFQTYLQYWSLNANEVISIWKQKILYQFEWFLVNYFNYTFLFPSLFLIAKFCKKGYFYQNVRLTSLHFGKKKLLRSLLHSMSVASIISSWKKLIPGINLKDYHVQKTWTMKWWLYEVRLDSSRTCTLCKLSSYIQYEAGR